MTVFFLGMSISNALAHHIRSNNLLSRFHAKVSKIGWNLDVGGTNSACIGRDSVCCYYLLESYRDWNGIPKLLPYSWIPEGRWGFESAWFWFFCIFLFQCSCFCLSYSLTVIWITPNWLLFVLYYNCPAPFCWIRNPKLIYFSFSVWKWLPLMTLKLDPVYLKCCRWCPVNLPLYLC